MIRVRTKWIALAAIAAGVGLGVYWGLTTPPQPPSWPLPERAEQSFPDIAPPERRIPESCHEARYAAAAARNADTLRSLLWAPFRRPEQGWEIYATLIADELATDCPPTRKASPAPWPAGRRRAASPSPAR